MSTSKLLQLTRKLREYNQVCHHQFVNKTNNGEYEVDFFGEVKPFADEVKIIADEWLDIAISWLRENKQKYLYEPQLRDTHENIINASILAFQLDTRDNKFKQKRFLETIKSIDYVLEILEENVNRSNG